MTVCGTIVGMSTQDIGNIRYPTITVQLSGQDGNAFFMIGRVSAALKANGVPIDERVAFQREAMSGSYDHALQTTMRWVDTA